MDLFRDRRERTVVMRLPRGANLYRRKDVLAGVKRAIRCDKIDALGQLENNMRWEVVLSDVATKQRLLSSPKLPVGDYEATLEPLYQTTKRLRITRVPMCVPNEYIKSLLHQHNTKVISMQYDIDKEDGFQTNIRIATVTSEDWETIPDRLNWELGGLRGTALLYLQGRSPRCYRCAERGHKFYQSLPFLHSLQEGRAYRGRRMRSTYIRRQTLWGQKTGQHRQHGDGGRADGRAGGGGSTV